MLNEPPSNRAALGFKTKPFSLELYEPTTLCQPTPVARSRSSQSRRTYRMPAPSGPSSHLWPSAARKSRGVLRTSIVCGPRPWIASTKSATPRVLAELDQGVKVVAETGGELDVADREDSGAASIAAARSSIQIRPSRLAT